jgi:glutamate synthase domain-containing protein 3
MTQDRDMAVESDQQAQSAAEAQRAAAPAGACATIDAAGKPYRQVNEEVRAALAAGAGCVELLNVRGQRYLGCGLGSGARLVIRGVPGNDLAAFMDGCHVVVHGNAQDGVANTMNAGRVEIHGDAGDVLAHSMRGGTMLVRGSAGYRAGIHMKSYRDKQPVVVIGGAGNDYLGEYMAGGLLIVLGLGRAPRRPISGLYTGTGMHGGKIILGDDVEPARLGAEVGKSDLDDADRVQLRRYVEEYVAAFGGSVEEILAGRFVKLLPISRRPYGQIYVY